MKRKMSTIEAVYKIGRLVFTTREIAGLAGASVSSTVQALRRLEEKGITKNILRGVWGMVNDRRFSPFFIVPFLNPNHRAYVSFISALHSHGEIGICKHDTVGDKEVTKSHAPVGLGLEG